MARLVAVLVGAALGAAVAIAVLAAYISVRYPNNERDSGLPDVAVAMILGGPAGAILGGVIGAVVPLRRRDP